MRGTYTRGLGAQRLALLPPAPTPPPMDADPTDLAGVAQPRMHPRPAGVARSVDRMVKEAEAHRSHQAVSVCRQLQTTRKSSG